MPIIDDRRTKNDLFKKLEVTVDDGYIDISASDAEYSGMITIKPGDKLDEIIIHVSEGRYEHKNNPYGWWHEITISNKDIEKK